MLRGGEAFDYLFGARLFLNSFYDFFNDFIVYVRFEEGNADFPEPFLYVFFREPAFASEKFECFLQVVFQTVKYMPSPL